MSFFGRLFGGDPDTHRRNADAHFERGAFGEAKLAYEKARDALPSDRRSERDGMAARIDACRDGIARTRLAQAQAYRTQGERSLAAEELRGALEVAADRALGAEIQAVLDDLDRVEVQQANRGVTLSRDERIAILAGSWYEEQATEYASYGDEFFEALLALDDERFEDARAGFAQVLKTAEAPIYVILEHAKACTLVGDSAAATAGYVRFLEALPEGAGGERRLAAHLQIGVLRSLGGDPEGALDAFQGAIEDFPDDHRPYFALGQQLRLSGAPGEALEVLELSLDRAGASPEWALIEEIGITCADLGQLARATELLEDVLKRFVDRGDAYIPPRSAWRLAAHFAQHLAAFHRIHPQRAAFDDGCGRLDAEQHEAGGGDGDGSQSDDDLSAAGLAFLEIGAMDIHDRLQASRVPCSKCLICMACVEALGRQCPVPSDAGVRIRHTASVPGARTASAPRPGCR